MWTGKGRSGIGDTSIQGTWEDWDGLSPNGRQYKNAITQETRNLSGQEYWNARKADYPSQETEVWKDGKANIAAFKEAQAKPKTQAKKSAFQTITLADSHYERLANLSEELDKELESGKLSFDDWSYARKTLDVRLQKAWQRLSKARGWDDQLEACTEQRRGFRIDYSVLSADSVFSGLKDENFFKIGYTKLLTAMKWMTKIAATGKKVLEEGLV
jgi:hypothetical protein